jgi:hypothetical protein
MRGVAQRADANVVAQHLASGADALSPRTTLLGRAFFAAAATVVVVALQVDARSTAVRQLRSATHLARAKRTDRAVTATGRAVAAVRTVALEIDAALAARRLARATAFSVHALLLGRTLRSALAAVFVVGV